MVNNAFHLDMYLNSRSLDSLHRVGSWSGTWYRCSLIPRFPGGSGNETNTGVVLHTHTLNVEGGWMCTVCLE